MKLALNTDFTQLPRAGAHVAAETAREAEAFDHLVLDHEERVLRRRVLATARGTKILVDLPDSVTVSAGDLLVLDDGRAVRVEAASEAVYAVMPHDAKHLGELCWHLGSHHVDVAVEGARLLVLPDPATRSLIEGLGASVVETTAPFQPVPAWNAAHHHDHGHGHHHHHDHGHHDDHGHHHDHGHGETDAFGRKPGDPHYGHNHP